MATFHRSNAYHLLAAAVLVAHQRRSDSGCLCGWAELGASYAEHVTAVLDEAGALRDRPPTVDGIRGHLPLTPEQHDLQRAAYEATALTDEALADLALAGVVTVEAPTDEDAAADRRLMDDDTSEDPWLPPSWQARRSLVAAREALLSLADPKVERLLADLGAIDALTAALGAVHRTLEAIERG